MKTKISYISLFVILSLVLVSSVVAAENKNNATSTNAKADGQITAEEHRSTVASFVKSLQDVADIEGESGIGDQVRVVAQAQNDSASTSAEAITKVKNRSKWQTFLFGSDYKNLGKLRSEMVTTQNNIDQLNNLITKAKYNMDKAELTNQIKVLENTKTEIEAFIKTKESSFSLLGWLVKPFVK
jgi:flagellin-like hook-associated protein FlgL